MDLHHGLAAGHRVVVHVWVEKGKTTGGKGGHLFRIKDVTHTKFEGPRDDRHVFPQGMKVRSNPVPVGHLQAYRIVPVRGGRIALEHRELRSGS